VVFTGGGLLTATVARHTNPPPGKAAPEAPKNLKDTILELLLDSSSPIRSAHRACFYFKFLQVTHYQKNQEQINKNDKSK